MTTTNTTPKFVVLGTTDSVCKCDHCGRTDLKKTVALGLLDADGNWDGDVTYYGTTCAAHAIAPRKSFTHGTATTFIARKSAEGRVAQRALTTKHFEQFFAALTAEVPAFIGCTDRRVVNNIDFARWEERGLFPHVVFLYKRFKATAANKNF